MEGTFDVIEQAEKTLGITEKDASFVGTGVTPTYIETDRDAQESLAKEILLDMIEAYEAASENTPE